MAFYGFPGETLDEALETRQFVLDNQPVIHSMELFYFVAYRHTPMVRNPEKFGITIHKQEEYDLPAGLLLHVERPEHPLMPGRDADSAKNFTRTIFTPGPCA